MTKLTYNNIIDEMTCRHTGTSEQHVKKFISDIKDNEKFTEERINALIKNRYVVELWELWIDASDFELELNYSCYGKRSLNHLFLVDNSFDNDLPRLAFNKIFDNACANARALEKFYANAFIKFVTNADIHDAESQKEYFQQLVESVGINFMHSTIK